MAVLCISSTRGEYGDKVRSNASSSSTSSENFSSSEEYYDDSLEERQTSNPEKPSTTTTEDEVIENSVLPAPRSTTPSYNIIDYPMQYDESLGDSYTQAIFNDNKGLSGNLDSLSSPESDQHKKTNTETMQKSPQTHNGFSLPNWSYLEMYNIAAKNIQKPFSASYRNPQPLNMFRGTEGDYDTVENGNYPHLRDYSSLQNPLSYFNDVTRHEVLSRIEQDRKYQIESTKYYIEQAKAAQDYAARVQALQNTLYPSFNHQMSYPGESNSNMKASYGSSAATVTSQIHEPIALNQYALGINSLLQKDSHDSKSFRSQPPTTVTQVHSSVSAAGGGRMSPFTVTAPYSGPTASPVVLPSGYLADTAEVMQARIAHLQALMNAIEADPSWRGHKSQRFDE